MNGHKPDEAFTPAVTKKFGVENVVVVQDAQGGQPILRWHKDWHAPDGSTPDKTGDLYDRLISKVKPAIKGKKIATVTFFWMQGERDARSKWGDVYERSLRGIHKQLSDDLDATTSTSSLADLATMTWKIDAIHTGRSCDRFNKRSPIPIPGSLGSTPTT